MNCLYCTAQASPPSPSFSCQFPDARFAKVSSSSISDQWAQRLYLSKQLIDLTMSDNEDSLTINLTLTAVPSSPRVSVVISLSDSPSDFRRKAAEATKIPLETLRLIFRGRLIADQSETNAVNEFKLEEGCVVHCMGKPIASVPPVAPAAAAATTTAPAGSIVTMTSVGPSPAASVGDTLQTALTNLRSSNSSEVFLTAVSTLDKVLSNIVAHPMEQKYQRVKKDNAAFHRRLGGLRGGHDAMLAVGFTVISTDGDEFYVIHPSPEAWPRLVSSKEVIAHALRDAQVATMTSAPPAVAASMPSVMGMPGMGSVMPGMMGAGMPPGGLTPEMQAAAAQMMSDPNALRNMLQVRFFVSIDAAT
jgi:hypothetical protein